MHSEKTCYSLWQLTLSLSFLCFSALSSTPAQAQAFGCGTPIVDFESPLTWTIIDHAGSGPRWGSIASCGEAGNYTGGSDEALCVSSDIYGPAEFDTEIRTPMFNLAGVSSAILSYAVNYQNFANSDFLDLDISTDGSTWVNILSWNEDHGAFRNTPGQNVIVDLTPYAGFKTTRLRWRYYDPNIGDWGWYAQIDDIALVCTGGADIRVSKTADADSIAEGQVVTYSIEVVNNGPSSASNISVTDDLPSGFADLQVEPLAPPASLTVTYDGFTALIPALAAGESLTISAQARAEFRRVAAFEVVSPASIAGEYPSLPALFGPALSSEQALTGKVVLVNDGSPSPTLGCDTLINTAELAGNIALFDRGTCEFGLKVKNAQEAGAIAAIVGNYAAGGDTLTSMAPGVHGALAVIPSIFIGYSTINAIKGELASQVMVSMVAIRPESEHAINRVEVKADQHDPDQGNNVANAAVTVLKDLDGDGTPDIDDGCPSDPLKSAPGACGCGNPDDDSDHDGTPDCLDACPEDPGKSAPGICGCGIADADLNSNGIIDCLGAEELGARIAEASNTLRKLKQIKLTGNKKRDKARKKQLKTSINNLRALAQDISAFVQNNMGIIRLTSATVDLPKLTALATKALKKALNTRAKNFARNKKIAQKKLANLKSVLAEG